MQLVHRGGPDGRVRRTHGVRPPWSVAARLGAALLVASPLVVVGLLTAATNGPAQAATTDPYLVTLVARECPTYTDIMANLARNNIQESLEDLGKDSVYRQGQPISPSVEEPNQPGCTPLDGWTFTFGSGIAGRTNNLSTVANPGSPMTVQPEVPLLDAQGRPTGQSIAAAVTVTLTQAQVNAALSHNLWVQGGTPSDPLVTSSFGNRYAFGALRCAIDNLNGDNVEWVGFPSGSTSVFCYYYAVDKIPAPGTLVIRKQLASAEPETNTFHFQGNVSYNPGGTFEIPVTGAAPGSISFVRSSGVAWNFTELADPGFVFQSLDCTGPGTSTFPAPSTTDPSATVTLGSGDTVTCTYTDARPVLGKLNVLKQTTGGSGGPFDLSVTPPSGTPTPLVATTAAPDDPVAATTPSGGAFAPTLVTGTYSFTEDLSAVNAGATDGTWSATGFDCNGLAPTSTNGSTSATFDVSPGFITSGDSLECTFTNTFTPDATLTITKTTTGGVGSTDFVVSAVTPVDPSGDGTADTADSLLTATTTHPGVAATAVQTGGDTLNPIDPGQYSIVEEGPEDSPLGTWSPVSITCNGTASDPTSSDVLVTVSSSDPHVTCAFTNTFTAAAPAISTTTTAASGSGSTAASSAGVRSGLASTGVDVVPPLVLGLGMALVGLLLMGTGWTRTRRTRRPPRP